MLCNDLLNAIPLAGDGSVHERTIGYERNMSQIHAEVPDRVVAANTLVAGDSEEDDEEEEDDIEQDEEEDTEDDGYSE